VQRPKLAASAHRCTLTLASRRVQKKEARAAPLDLSRNEAGEAIQKAAKR
jgi:hypothetical protein